jgi:hypothetical protein
MNHVMKKFGYFLGLPIFLLCMLLPLSPVMQYPASELPQQVVVFTMAQVALLGLFLRVQC